MNEQTDKLKELFHEIKLDNTSQDFMKNMMFRIEKESIIQKRKKQLILYLILLGGVAGIIGLPVLIFSFMGIDIRLFDEGSLNFSFSMLSNLKRLDMNVDPNIIILCSTVLLLLMGDLLFRKHARH